MQYKVARGLMDYIAKQAQKGELESAGISQEDFELVTGPRVWTGYERNRVTQSFHALLQGSVILAGLPPFQMPAEYLAAGVALFVHPMNAQAICRIIEKAPSAESLGRGVEHETCTAKQIFGLVVQLVADPTNSHAKSLFEKRTGLKIQEAEMLGKKPKQGA